MRLKASPHCLPAMRAGPRGRSSSTVELEATSATGSRPISTRRIGRKHQQRGYRGDGGNLRADPPLNTRTDARGDSCPYDPSCWTTAHDVNSRYLVVKRRGDLGRCRPPQVTAVRVCHLAKNAFDVRERCLSSLLTLSCWYPIPLAFLPGAPASKHAACFSNTNEPGWLTMQKG
jgi:hypothetical protein